MSLRIRRGLEASRSSITPLEGEFLYTTDTKSVYMGDGTTAGGIAVGSGSTTQYLQVANATTLFNDRLTVANSRNYLQVANSKTYLQVANATTLFNNRLTVANSRNYLQVANATTLFNNRLTVANSKTYLQVANATTLFNNRLTVANSKTYLQVANATATYQTKAVERAALANTNSRIGLLNTNLTGTNTALRALIDTKANNVGAADQILYRNSSNVLTSSSGLRYDGTNFKVNGNLESVYSSGDEGGEIFLNKPVTSTSITTGVFIDVYQNRLRFWEAGGSNRGAYIDLTAAGTGVGSNLLAGGGGSSSNSFSGILVGANVVVADSTSDTLTFVAGSGMAIAANPTTDTITFSSTGGSTTQYLQVSNATTLFNNRLTVANSRNYLQVANSKTYLQVANAITLYATKSNPTTSGLLAHTGRVTVSTNLYVSGNSVFGDPTATTDRTVINGVLVANGNLSVAGNTTIGAAGKTVNSTGWFGVTGRATVSTNLFVAGNTTVRGLLANGSLGTANFVLKTNGTTTFWGAAAAGGGGGVTLADETASATTHYPAMSTTSTGTWSAGRVSTTKLYFTPSTGQLNATIFNSLSDKRVKKNIKIVDDALNTVNGMRGVKFNWKETSTPSIGLIAQEVEKLLPELVHTGHNGEKSVNYGGVVGVLVEAIKELTKRIDKLEGK